MNTKNLEAAADIIRTARRVAGFTGAGISVESGIPPFRGEGGIWSKYDPSLFDIHYFQTQPEKAWELIKEIFYSYFGKAEPNGAHIALARLEVEGKLSCIITQNIDSLHQEAGNTDVVEFHGNSRRLVCLKCSTKLLFTEALFDNMPPRCEECSGILKPDFIFFGEAIPVLAQERALTETRLADVWIVIGTTGTVFPAASIPIMAKQYGSTIIEVNARPSAFTDDITDIFLEGKAAGVMTALIELLYPEDTPAQEE